MDSAEFSLTITEGLVYNCMQAASITTATVNSFFSNRAQRYDGHTVIAITIRPPEKTWQDELNCIKVDIMSMKNVIESKLQTLQPAFLEVVNESNKHNVPEGSESHFKVTIISSAFEGKTLVARHQMVNGILADELANAIHALALHTMTQSEWFDKGEKSNNSPPCRGGSGNQ